LFVLINNANVALIGDANVALIDDAKAASVETIFRWPARNDFGALFDFRKTV